MATNKPEPAQDKPKRKRSRTGYVMVELSDDDRARLDRIRARLEAEAGRNPGLAGAIRHLIRRAK